MPAKHRFYDELGNRFEELGNLLPDMGVYKGNAFRYAGKWYKILEIELLENAGEVTEIKALIRETTLRDELKKSKNYPGKFFSS